MKAKIPNTRKGPEITVGCLFEYKVKKRSPEPIIIKVVSKRFVSNSTNKIEIKFFAYQIEMLNEKDRHDIKPRKFLQKLNTNHNNNINFGHDEVHCEI